MSHNLNILSSHAIQLLMWFWPEMKLFVYLMLYSFPFSPMSFSHVMYTQQVTENQANLSETDTTSFCTLHYLKINTRLISTSSIIPFLLIYSIHLMTWLYLSTNNQLEKDLRITIDIKLATQWQLSILVWREKRLKYLRNLKVSYHLYLKQKWSWSRFCTEKTFIIKLWVLYPNNQAAMHRVVMWDMFAWWEKGPLCFA